jgi:hypothetical protein
MEFYKYIDSWSALKKANLRQHFKSQEELWEFKMTMAEELCQPFTYRRALLEQEWCAASRPYYNLYPAILPMLTGLKLNIHADAVSFDSIKAIEVRLPKNQNEESPFKFGNNEVRSVLFALQDMPKNTDADELVKGLCVCFDIGEMDAVDFEPIYSFRLLPLQPELTIEESMNVLSVDDSASIGVQVPDDIAINVVKICICLMMLDRDPTVVTPDILVKDLAKWDAASEAEKLKLIEKAKSRGKNGWNIGAFLEKIPHIRRPHPALVRVGKGRTLTRIVMRKGSVVHRNKITEVPSGYESSSD